ncbi:hypothetical protein HYQ46_008422 [Verticillium longisporum]|nr:hypothetical protein HYQ46_008422 [Verticillium longisporum]
MRPGRGRTISRLIIQLAQSFLLRPPILLQKWLGSGIATYDPGQPMLGTVATDGRPKDACAYNLQTWSQVKHRKGQMIPLNSPNKSLIEADRTSPQTD